MLKKDKKVIPTEIKKIGLRLKGIRKSLGYGNSDDFANNYGLNRSQYGKYETGSEDLRISSLLKILEKLNMDLPTFFNAEFENL